MSATLTIARRELTSLFFSPIGYVVLGLFAIGAVLIFTLSFGPGNEATMAPTYGGVVWLLIFLAPAISMRLLSEELRVGTFETLMTSPVDDTQVVVGKWLGAMGFYLVLLSPLVLLIGVMEATANPDYGPVLTGLLGLLLVGGLYLAIGTFASTLTQNQIIAFLLSVFVISLLTFLTAFLPRAQWVRGGFEQVLLYINVQAQFGDFNKGLIDIRNFAYFVSGIVLFLYLAIKLLESRRWR